MPHEHEKQREVERQEFVAELVSQICGAAESTDEIEQAAHRTFKQFVRTPAAGMSAMEHINRVALRISQFSQHPAERELVALELFKKLFVSIETRIHGEHEKVRVKT